MAIDELDNLWVWGCNEFGQLGDGANIDKLIPTKIMDGKKIIDVAAGDDHSMAIDITGNIWVWGTMKLDN